MPPFTQNLNDPFTAIIYLSCGDHTHKTYYVRSTEMILNANAMCELEAAIKTQCRGFFF